MTGSLLNSMFGTTTAPPDISDNTMRLPGGRTVKVVEKQAEVRRTGIAEKQHVALPPDLAAAILDVRAPRLDGPRD